MKVKGVDIRPLLLLATLGAANVVVVQLSPGQDWLQTYGPNSAVALFELAVAVGIVQAYVERQRLLQRIPIQRQALRRAQELTGQLMKLERAVPLFYQLQKEGHQDKMSSAAELLKRHPKFPADMSLGPPSPDTLLMREGRKEYAAGEYLWEANCRLRELYDEYGALIAEFAPSDLSESIENAIAEGGESFLASVARINPSMTVNIVWLDLADYQAFESAVTQLRATLKALDVRPIGVPWLWTVARSPRVLSAQEKRDIQRRLRRRRLRHNVEKATRGFARGLRSNSKGR